MNICVDFSNPFVIVFFVGTVLSLLINHFMEFIDYKARKRNGGQLPEEIKDDPLAIKLFDSEKLDKICKYENAKYFFWIPSNLCSTVLSFSLLIFGFYPWIFNLIIGWTGFPGGIGSSFLCFFLFIILSSVPESILSIPFDLLRQFKLEKKFDFNSMTIGLWIADQIKGLVLSLILGALLSFVASLFFVKCPDSWWVVLASVMIGFTFIMQVIYPKFIAPLFNKFSPLEEGELKSQIDALLKKTGFVSGGLFVMDESKRSKHSNAYFTGFGKSKRIVLYDTLIKSLSIDELVAVLGHELGHFKLKHILKRLLIVIPMEFVIMFVLYKFAQYPAMYNGFGFAQITASNVASVQFIGLFLAAAVWGSVSELVSPFTTFTSRKNEYAADRFAAEVTGNPENLVTALMKLNADNLSELLPPKLYVFWNYSHPTIIERISALRKLNVEHE